MEVRIGDPNNEYDIDNGLGEHKLVARNYVLDTRMSTVSEYRTFCQDSAYPDLMRYILIRLQEMIKQLESNWEDLEYHICEEIQIHVTKSQQDLIYYWRSQVESIELLRQELTGINWQLRKRAQLVQNDPMFPVPKNVSKDIAPVD